MNADRHRRHLAAGEVLFREGDRSNEAYVIESGRIELYVGEREHSRFVTQLGPDEMLGEMTLISGQPRAASAVALEPSTLMAFTREYLESRLDAADPLLRHLLSLVIARGRDSMQRLSQTGVQPRVSNHEIGMTEAADRSAALRSLRLERAMEAALDDGSFQLHLQPIVRMQDASPAGFEALIRWPQPDGSLLSPSVFIPVAEQSELIYLLGHWIIRNACAALARLDRAVPGRQPFISINLSSRQLGDPALFPVLEAALREGGIAPQRMRLEITESMIARDTAAVLGLLRHCKALGAKLSVDDFGTGYSSLSYLQQFPVDSLKLDRSFIRELESSPAAAKIVGAVARLAADLGMETVAEGIETAGQAALCRQLGIDYGQGYHYAEALSQEAAADYLRRAESFDSP